jgi:hypothetical protein
MLVPQSIAGSSFGQATSTGNRGQIVLREVGPSIPTSVRYFVDCHKPDKTLPSGSFLMASATVTDYPNPEWAKYELRNVPLPNADFLEASEITSVTRLGNRIMMNTSSSVAGGLDFYWPSGSKTVLIHFYVPEDDAILKEYLALDPSSM